jgi:KDO2-lipid IV(A) lauroyltransferase
VVSANLAQVLGKPADSPIVRAATREAFDSYAGYWHETFRLRVLSDAELASRMRPEGMERIHADLEAGHGSIVASPHIGNWDAVAGWASRVDGLPVMVVAEALRPQRLLDLFTRHREELGMQVVPLEDGGDALKKLRSHLEDNGVVALVCDRDISGRGVTVNMFGRERRLPVGPAYLSLATGAPVHGISSVSEKGGWRFRIGEALSLTPSGDRRADVDALTQLLAADFERTIAAWPTDWHMFQPAWS